MELLLLLVERHGQVVSREQIVERVWGKDVFLDSDNSINAAIRKIRLVLDDVPEHPRFIQTLTGKGYRFIAPVEEVVTAPAPSLPVAEDRIPLRTPTSTLRSSRRWLMLAGVALLAVAAGWLALHNYSKRASRLTADDTIVLGDFANSTGDAIFDDVLKQALAVTLRQSPFLNILPESKVNKTLKLMTRQAGTALTPALASEVCQRAGSKAYVAGAIGTLGSEYVLGLKAMNCRNGDILAQEQTTAASKEKVLGALGDAATRLRRELGESLATIQKYDVPLSEATTSSLEALQAYTQGLRAWNAKGEAEALPLFQRAIELDPKFASAYVSLGTVYQNLEEPGLGNASFAKAYELRDRVSEREKFYILGHYFGATTGELEKAIPVYEQWQKAYPSDPTPFTNLGNIEIYLGRYEQGLAQHKLALRIEPNGILIHENLTLTNALMGRYDDAVAIAQDAFARNLDDATLHNLLMQLGFVRGDSATVSKELAWSMGKPGIEDGFLFTQSDIEASMGHIAKAREYCLQAVDSAARNGSKETAAFWQIQGALREADTGYPEQAAQQASAALALARDRSTLILAAVAWARAHREDRATELVAQLRHDYPVDLMIQSYWLPSVQAMLDLNRGRIAEAMNSLQTTAPYDLASPTPLANLYPVYTRGEALLRSHRGNEAAAEFQKVLDHPARANFISVSLAQLELGRAYAVAGDSARAKKAYEDFLALWKDGDADVPVLRQARTEYARIGGHI